MARPLPRTAPSSRGRARPHSAGGPGRPFRAVRQWWAAVASSLWALPTAIVVGGVALAVLLVRLSVGVTAETLARVPYLLGAGAAGARGMLSTIAGSMITVAGVTFSITIAAVAQTSTQYTPRVLRTFMGDRANQAVLGAFVGIFAYCLVVLRTIRGGDEGAFVPTVAVLGGFLLALLGVGVLIYFIVHIAASLQAGAILERVRAETERAVDALFPADLGAPAGGEVDAPALAHATWRPLRAPASGYVQQVDEAGLLAFAAERGVVLRMVRGVGDFAVAGALLAEVTTRPDAAPDPDARDADERALAALYTFSSYRTVRQDAGFGLLQLGDIALKALSPGINDTTTAVTCVAHISALVARLATRRLPERARADAGGVRVIAVGPTFAGLVGLAFDDVRRNAGANVTVLHALLDGLSTAGGCTDDPARRAVLAEQVVRLAEAAARQVEAPEDRAALAARAEAVRAALAAPSGATP